MTSPLDVTSAFLKVNRAIELFDGLHDEVRAWRETNPYRIFTYISPNYRRASVIVKTRVEPPMSRWSLIFADIIHNLRCALDHTLWAVLLREFHGNIPNDFKQLTFPIWDGPPNANQRKRFGSLDPKVFSAVESVQAYHYPSLGLPVHPLAIIRDIDNENKHRLLFTLVPSVARIRIKATGLRHGYRNGTNSEVYRGELKDDVEVIVTTFDSSQPYLKYECVLFMGVIAVRHPVAGRLGQDRDDYAALVDILVEEVRRTIGAFIIASEVASSMKCQFA